MKKLILIRHGRAEEQITGISDFERSLSTKGKNISRLMARRLMEEEDTPGIIITSPAFRALETAIIFSREFGMKPDKIFLDSTIYSKMNLKLLPGILSTAKDAEMVTLVGHNPSITEIADSLCTEECGFIPKSGVIGISFNITSWSEVKPNSGEIMFFLKPEKEL
ncbi:MAG TPA: histidine phosphatase family protein [Bacteroidales bacterium]|nr:histidine phosphatase family protein [Bacteroidales bacterium]